MLEASAIHHLGFITLIVINIGCSLFIVVDGLRSIHNPFKPIAITSIRPLLPLWVGTFLAFNFVELVYGY